jgi:hypothetical protein
VGSTPGAKSLQLYAVGNRGDSFSPDGKFSNILFRMDASDTNGSNFAIGDAQSKTSTDFGKVTGNVAFTDRYQAPVGRIDTSTGSGGFITGIANVGTEVYGVTNVGGLFRLTNGFGGYTVIGGVIDTLYISDTDFAGEGLNFTGLSAGPRNNAGNNSYETVLFATTNNGDIHAFDVMGNYQHVFQGDRAVISTGLTGIQGVEFGTLNRNLWHTTNTRNGDAGHGLTVPVTNTRQNVTGGLSMHFGNEVNPYGDNSQNTPWGNATSGDYNLPGNAHGTVITDPFSLYGYSAADLPTLYFTYFLESDGQNYAYNPTGPDTPATDAFRVFVAGDDGEWQLLGTNNSFRSSDITAPFLARPIRSPWESSAS